MRHVLDECGEVEANEGNRLETGFRCKDNNQRLSTTLNQSSISRLASCPIPTDRPEMTGVVLDKAAFLRVTSR